jgi:hypothetical protein
MDTARKRLDQRREIHIQIEGHGVTFRNRNHLGEPTIAVQPDRKAVWTPILEAVTAKAASAAPNVGVNAD